MYDEAGTTTPSSSFDFGGGGGGDGGYDSSVTYQPTVTQLNDLGPGRVGDSGITTILNNIKGYVGGSPTVSRGIGGLLGSIIGNFFMPGIGSLVGGYLGNRQGANYSNRYNLNREAMTDFLGGRINTSPIYQPTGINKINTPNFTNPNIITDPNLNDSFYLDNLMASKPDYKVGDISDRTFDAAIGSGINPYTGKELEPGEAEKLQDERNNRTGLNQTQFIV